MKMYYSASSPFVRKVMMVAHELGVADRIERLDSAVHPVRFDASVVAHNPLGQVPTFFTEHGEVLYDSRVICEYLDAVHGSGNIFPVAGPARWRALREQALADGALQAGLLVRYELTVRAPAQHNQDWITGQRRKLVDALAVIDAEVPAQRLDIGTISLACLLGYLDFRFPDIDWRSRHPDLVPWMDAFSRRPSFQATKPVLPRPAA
ncbi:MAG: glutathione S-transferase [Castellaniella sp.]